MSTSRKTTEAATKNLPPLAERKDVNQCVVETDDTDEDAEANEAPNQTVQVNGHPCHICLSGINYDEGLIEYLQMHPITKRYFICFCGTINQHFVTLQTRFLT